MLPYLPNLLFILLLLLLLLFPLLLFLLLFLLPHPIPPAYLPAPPNLAILSALALMGIPVTWKPKGNRHFLPLNLW